MLASFGGGPIVAIQAIAGGLLYGRFTLTLGRKLLRGLGVIAERNGEISPTLLGVTLMLLMLVRLQGRCCTWTAVRTTKNGNSRKLSAGQCRAAVARTWHQSSGAGRAVRQIPKEVFQVAA